MTTDSPRAIKCQTSSSSMNGSSRVQGRLSRRPATPLYLALVHKALVLYALERAERDWWQTPIQRMYLEDRTYTVVRKSPLGDSGLYLECLEYVPCSTAVEQTVYPGDPEYDLPYPGDPGFVLPVPGYLLKYTRYYPCARPVSGVGGPGVIMGDCRGCLTDGCAR